MKPHNSPNNSCIFAILWNIFQRFFDYASYIMFHKRETNATGYKDSPINSVPIMRNACRLLGKSGCKLRIPWSYKSPRVNKYLSPDLLCHCRSILLYASASRSGNTVSQIQICRMFSRNSVTAPPEKSVFIWSIVEKRIPYIFCTESFQIFAILQRTDEKQGSIAVIVGGKILITC